MADFGIRVTYDNSEVSSGLKENKGGFSDLADSVNNFDKTTSKATTSAGRNLQQIQSQASGLNNTFKTLVATIGAAFGTREVFNFGKEAVKAAGDYETLNISVSTFLKSQEKANKLLLETQKFSVKTPFTPEQVNKAAKSLLAFGVEQDKIIPKLSRIGDISAGTNKDFNELATIYGKARIAGTLYAEDINQLVEAGIPIISEFAKQLNISESEVKKFASEGKLSFADLETAFESLTSEGGLFFGLMESQSESFNGRVSTLQGLFEDVRRQLGTELIPVMKEGVEDAIRFFESFKAEDIQNFAKNISTALSLLRDYGPFLLKCAAAKFLLGKAIQLYNRDVRLATGETVKLRSVQGLTAITARALGAAFGAIGIGLVVQGLSLLISNWERVTDVLTGVTRAQRSAMNASTELRQEFVKEAAEMENLFKVLRDGSKSRSEQKAILDEINAKYPGVLKNLDLEKGSLEDIAMAQRLVNEEIKKGLILRLNEKDQLDTLDKTAELQAKINDLQEKGIGIGATLKQAFVGSETNTLFKSNAERTEIAIRDLEKQIEEENKLAETRQKARTDAANKLFGLETTITTADESRRRDDLKRRQEAYTKLSKLNTDQLKSFKATSDLEKNIINELLAERNKITGPPKGSTTEAKKAYENFVKEIKKLQDDLQKLQSSNEVSGEDDQIKKIEIQRRQAREQIKDMEAVSLATARTEEERTQIQNLYTEIRKEINKKYNEELIKAIDETEEKEAQKRKAELDNLKELNDQALQLEMKKIDAQLAVGGLSLEKKRRLEEEQLLITELAKEREIEILKQSYSEESTVVQAAYAELEKIQKERQATILNNQIDYLGESSRLRLEDIERELRFGNLSLQAREALEKEKLQIMIATAEAQLKLLPPEGEEARRLKSTLEDLRAEFKSTGAATLAEVGDFGALFKANLLEAFNIRDDEAQAIVEGLGQLKEIIADIINSGYEAELAGLDDMIEKRKESISELESLIEDELSLKEDGFANSYDALNTQLSQERALLQEEEKRRFELQKQQLKNQAIIESAQQTGAIITAVANVIKDSSKFGIAGLAVAAVGIASLFAIWKGYRAQVKGLTRPDSLYKGGALSDYMEPGVSPSSDRPGRGGKGHRVEGTNLIVGGDEYLVNGRTTGRHKAFLDLLNSGKLDHFNLTHMIKEGYKRPSLEVMVNKVEAQDQKKETFRKQNEVIAMKTAYKEVLQEQFAEQNALLLEIDERRPTIIPHADGSVEKEYNTRSGVRRIKIKRRA